MKEKEFDFELWNYIDGLCTPEERLRIEDRLTSDPRYSEAYHELLSVEAELLRVELEEPSMSFTRNVMDALKDDPIPAAIIINKRLIYGIAAFFSFVFAAVLTALLFSVNWTQQGGTLSFDMDFPEILSPSLLEGKYLTAFYLVDVVLALFIMDGFLRKRLLSKKLYK